MGAQSTARGQGRPEGYRVIRLTYRRIEREPEVVAAELRRLLARKDGRAAA